MSDPMFWQYVARGEEDECWPWLGSGVKGYGQLMRQNRRLLAHRYSWEMHNGPVPDGMQVLHRCDHPSCVNPRHLFLGTVADNMRDRDTKGRNAAGERHGKAKLTALQVQEIRRRYAAGGVSQSRLGREFGVTKQSIADIIHRRHWAEVG